MMISSKLFLLNPRTGEVGVTSKSIAFCPLSSLTASNSCGTKFRTSIASILKFQPLVHRRKDSDTDRLFLFMKPIPTNKIYFISVRYPADSSSFNKFRVCLQLEWFCCWRVVYNKKGCVYLFWHLAEDLLFYYLTFLVVNNKSAKFYFGLEVWRLTVQ